MRFPLFALCLSWSALAFAAGCRSRESPGLTPPAAPSVAMPARANEPRRFGATVPGGEALSLSSVMAKPYDFKDRPVVVLAKVRRNCTRRGCWMELSDEPGNESPGCRVTFKDYGFFVPLDSAGSNARVQGVVEFRDLSVDEVVHLESEGAKFHRKQADGSALEVRMVATGVELWREPG